MRMMNDRRLLLAPERLVRQARYVDPDVERVRRHVAKIRLQIEELERRTGRRDPAADTDGIH
jgi:hypothetical protein